jgi:DNA-binding beta-propeller fold protein YncE
VGQGDFGATTFVSNGKNCSGGDIAPFYPAYDPVNHDVYVPNSIDGGSLTVLSGSCKVLANLTFPGYSAPFAAAFNPTNNRIYVTGGHDKVYVISGLKLAHTISSKSFDGSTGVAFDPANSEMAVADSGSNSVTFISNVTVESTATVGKEPYLFAYDPEYSRLLVTNFESKNVTSMNAADPTDEADNINIPIGTNPIGIAFDYANDRDYLADGQNLTVISALGNQYGSILLPNGTGSDGGGTGGVVWDQAKLAIYAVNGHNLSVVQGLKVVRTVVGPEGAAFVGITYDEATDQVFATDYISGTVFVYN